MVLPRISTNISVVDVEPEADPLRLYLESLRRLSDLPDETLVLPAHGEPFRGLHARLDRLASGHHRGLERLRRISVATSAARQRGGLLGAVKRVGLGLAAGLTFARLYCLPTKPNPLPANARLAPTW